MSKKIQKSPKSLQIPKIILVISAVLSAISSRLAILFAAKLFTSPIKHKIPKREVAMDRNSRQRQLFIPSIKRSIRVYEYGTSDKKILLVHGWSGRGTQLYKIADALVHEGYATLSFDAPAHGKSSGNSSIMLDFIASILELEKQFGPFEAAIGHSLGGMSVLNAIQSGLKVNRAIVIGSGDIVQDILDDFIKKLKLKPIMGQKLSLYFEKKYGEPMDNYSAYKAAATTTIPVLVIHDKNDIEVPVQAGIHIHHHLKNGELMLTEGLGHRKILGDDTVIQKLIAFCISK